MPGTTLKELYVDELRDLYDNENQLIKALPKLAKAAQSEELKSGIQHHLEQTKEQAKRLERIFDALGETAKGKKCKGIQGIISEGSAALKEEWDGPVRDAAIISSAQRAEHYEIAAYGTVHEFAQVLGENEAASLISQTLDEEKQTDEKLTRLAHEINQEARGHRAGDEAGERHKSKAAGE